MAFLNTPGIELLGLFYPLSDVWKPIGHTHYESAQTKSAGVLKV